MGYEKCRNVMSNVSLSESFAYVLNDCLFRIVGKIYIERKVYYENIKIIRYLDTDVIFHTRFSHFLSSRY